MPVHLISVPYDSGHRAARMGRGPLHLAEGGAPDALRAVDPDLRVLPVEAASAFPTEIGTAFELHRAVAERVAAASRDGALPLVFSGNCNSGIGTVAGLQAASDGEPVGVVWFDGHGDCNTPETFAGDFLDAMGLSTLTGRCWQALAATVPGFRPVPDEHVILIGGHGMDEGSRRVLDRSKIANATAADIEARGAEAALGPVLDRFRAAGVERVYVHLDVDVLDARRVAPANEFAPTGGRPRSERPARRPGRRRGPIHGRGCGGGFLRSCLRPRGSGAQGGTGLPASGRGHTGRRRRSWMTIWPG